MNISSFEHLRFNYFTVVHRASLRLVCCKFIAKNTQIVLSSSLIFRLFIQNSSIQQMSFGSFHLSIER